MNIWRPSITPSAWGILQLQSCLKFSIAFAVSNCEIGNFINLEDNLNISVQNSLVIVTTVDFPTDGKATATRFSMRIAFLNWVSCFHKRGRTRSTSFSKFNLFTRKSNFHWSWKLLQWRFSHIMSNHFPSLSSCQTERVFGRISKQLSYWNKNVIFFFWLKKAFFFFFFFLMSCSNLLNFNFLRFRLFFRNTLKIINKNIFLFRSMFLGNIIIYMFWKCL